MKPRNSQTFDGLPQCIKVVELGRVIDHHLRRHRRFKDAEINDEELRFEAGSWAVHRREQTVQGRREVPLQTLEVGDQVTQQLEAAVGKH